MKILGPSSSGRSPNTQEQLFKGLNGTQLKGEGKKPLSEEGILPMQCWNPTYRLASLYNAYQFAQLCSWVKPSLSYPLPPKGTSVWTTGLLANIVGISDTLDQFQAHTKLLLLTEEESR